MDHMNDAYKNYIWSFFKELSSEEFEVKLFFDQYQLKIADKDLISEQIAQANWQSNLPPSKFFDMQKASVLFVHSLIPTNELENILKQASKSTLIIYIDLSSVFQSRNYMKWWQKIFLKPNNELNEELMFDWRTNPHRSKFMTEIELHKSLLLNALAKTEIID
jgi:hypothetical protein